MKPNQMKYEVHSWQPYHKNYTLNFRSNDKAKAENAFETVTKSWNRVKLIENTPSGKKVLRETIG